MIRDDDRKIVEAEVTECSSMWGLGKVTGKFESEKLDAGPLLDTRVELTITPFSIVWEDKEKLVKEIAKLIAFYSI